MVMEGVLIGICNLLEMVFLFAELRWIGMILKLKAQLTTMVTWSMSGNK